MRGDDLRVLPFIVDGCAAGILDTGTPRIGKVLGLVFGSGVETS